MKSAGSLVALLALGAMLAAIPGCPPAATTQESAEILPGSALDRAIVLLQVEARSKDADVRSNCIEALQPLADERALDVIAEGLHDPVWVVRFASAMASGQRRVQALKPVLQQLALTDPDHNVQVAAIFALARLGDTRHMGRLAETLASPEVSVRANTALALGMLGDKSAIPLLQSRARETEPRVKFEITAALARLGDTSGVTALVAFSVSKYVEDRIFAMAAWPDIDSPDAADVLLSGLQDPMPGNTSSEGALISDRIRLTAARGLGKLGNRAGLHGALALIDDSNPQTRALAALALGDMLQPAEERVLVHMLTDSDTHVRIAAAAALVELHARRWPTTVPAPR